MHVLYWYAQYRIGNNITYIYYYIIITIYKIAAVNFETEQWYKGSVGFSRRYVFYPKRGSTPAHTRQTCSKCFVSTIDSGNCVCANGIAVRRPVGENRYNL